MARTAEAKVKITTQNNTEKGLNDAQRNLLKFKKGTEATNKSMAKFAGSVANGIGIAAVATAGLVVGLDKLIMGAVESEKSLQNLKSVLAATGGASGMTLSSLEKLSSELSSTTLFDDDAINQANAVLLTFTNIGEEVFPSVTKAAANMASVLGGTLESNIELLGKSLSSPIEGIAKLQKSGVYLSDTQKQQIKDFMAVNDQIGAQTLLLDALNSKYGGAAENMAQTAIGSWLQMKKGFDDMLESLGKLLAESTTGISGAVNGIVGRQTERMDLQTAFEQAIKMTKGQLTPDASVLANANEWARQMKWLKRNGSGLNQIVYAGQIKKAEQYNMDIFTLWQKIAGEEARRSEEDTRNNTLAYLLGQLGIDNFGSGVETTVSRDTWNERLQEELDSFGTIYSDIEKVLGDLDVTITGWSSSSGLMTDVSTEAIKKLMDELNKELDIAKALGHDTDKVYEDQIKQIEKIIGELYKNVDGLNLNSGLLKALGEELERLRKVVQNPIDSKSSKPLTDNKSNKDGALPTNSLPPSKRSQTGNEKGEVNGLPPSKRSQTGNEKGEVNGVNPWSDITDLFKIDTGTSGMIGMLTGSLGPLASAFQSIAGPVALLQPVIEAMVGVLAPAVNIVIAPLMNALKSIGTIAGQMLLPILDALSPIFGILAQMLMTAIIPVFQILTPIIQVLASIIEIVLTPILKALAIVFEVVSSPVKWLGDLFTWVADVIKTAIHNFVEYIEHPFNADNRDIQEGPGKFTSDAFTGLADRIKAIWEADYGTNTFGENSWEDIFNGLTIETDPTATSGNGASYSGSQEIYITIQNDGVLVGENGMEAFALIVRKEFQKLDYYSA